MAIATYFHPQSLTASQYDGAIRELEAAEPRTQQAGFTTPASGPTTP